MYFNLFTPFIVTDPGGAGPRLVTPSCLDGRQGRQGRQGRHPHGSPNWGLDIMLVWEGGRVLWCKRGVKQSANQSFEPVQTPSVGPCEDQGFETQDRSSIDLIARVCPPGPDLASWHQYSGRCPEHRAHVKLVISLPAKNIILEIHSTCPIFISHTIYN